ncbi:MAG: hypothetical protein R6X02_00100, partial [Enhygromyxa sp.]
MHKLLAKLPAFALPFVTRSLRGGRGRRYALFSLIIAAATALVGLWLTLGSGSFEQAVRVELRLEQSEWERQQREFAVFAHSASEYEYLVEDAKTLRRQGAVARRDQDFGKVAVTSSRGLQLAQEAVNVPTWNNQADRALQEQARALVGGPAGRSSIYFSWDDPSTRAALERVIEREGVPEVRRYESPLGLTDALKVVGFFAGLALAACATVFGPLLVALQQAQERHENTLTPLTGTALRPRELALGLATGPSVVVAIFAAPQLLLFSTCALLVGDVMIALALVGSLAATGLF